MITMYICTYLMDIILSTQPFAFLFNSTSKVPFFMCMHHLIQRNYSTMSYNMDLSECIHHPLLIHSFTSQNIFSCVLLSPCHCYPDPVPLKLESVEESPGELIKMQIPGPHSQQFRFSRNRPGLGTWISRIPRGGVLLAKSQALHE